MVGEMTPKSQNKPFRNVSGLGGVWGKPLKTPFPEALSLFGQPFFDSLE